MTTILVTGGTGGLGRPTVHRLKAAGYDVRVLSRSPGDGRVVGDLTTGAGLAEALDGVDTVLHLATNRRKDAPATARLLGAAAHVRHLVFISIVGVDSIPYGYYRDKVECEALIAASGIPFTILRATQFHDFVGDFLRAQRRLPVVLALGVPVQTIAVEEVADRLVELTGDAPAGRVADIGGPQVTQLTELIATWQSAFGTRKPVWMLHLPGKLVAAFREGRHTTGLPGYGTGTFAQYAAAEAAR
jgi:uncharacterized protein YbjT (DUF2867 family)